MRGRSSEMQLPRLAFSSPTCLFLALIIQIGTWRLVFACEFGNKIERGTQSREIDFNGKNPCGFPSLQGGAEIIDQRLRCRLIDARVELRERAYVSSIHRGADPRTG